MSGRVLIVFSVLPAAPRTPAEIVRDLGAPQWAVRERATKLLTRAGEPGMLVAAEALRTADDPEVRNRLGRVIDRGPPRFPLWRVYWGNRYWQWYANNQPCPVPYETCIVVGGWAGSVPLIPKGTK